MSNSNLSVDYLLKDAIIPDDQNFCCLSFFLNEDNSRVKLFRVSGAFKTLEEAQEQAKLLENKVVGLHFTLEMGSWVAFDPLPNIGDLNGQLNQMMKRYLTELQKKNLEYEERKFRLVTNNILENRKIKEDELENELKEFNNITDEKVKNIKSKEIENIKEKIAELTTKYEEAHKKQLEFEEKLKNIKIDDSHIVTNMGEGVQNQNIPIGYKGKVNRTDEKIEGQNWFCVTFLTEENKSLVGVKISGCFDKEEDAHQHSRMLRDINNSFDANLSNDF